MTLIKGVYPKLNISDVDLEKLEAPQGDSISSVMRINLLLWIMLILQCCRKYFTGSSLLFWGKQLQQSLVVVEIVIKKPYNGEISCRLSDNVIFTSDNPRGRVHPLLLMMTETCPKITLFEDGKRQSN